MGTTEQDVLRTRLADFGVEVVETTDGEVRLAVESARAVELLTWLRDDPETAMHRLVDLTAVDRSGPVCPEAGFELIYRLHSPERNQRMRVHVSIERLEASVDTAVPIWPAANWFEREVFDLFGIRFRGHPDLRRILLDAAFEGAPLRKSYPRQPDLAPPKEAER